MPEDPAVRASRPVPWRPYFGVAFFFVLMLPLTAGLRAGRLAALRGDMEARRQALVTTALNRIAADFEATEQDLRREARALAEDPEVVEGLRAHAAGRAGDSVVALLAGRPLPPRRALEVYDAQRRLVAWSGFSVPLQAAVQEERALEGGHLAVVDDGAVRQALVAWWPVRDGTRALGAVRAGLLVAFQAPVENQYLGSFSLAERWQRLTGLPVAVTLAPPEAAPLPRGGDLATRRLLRSPSGGGVLGEVQVEPPVPEALLAEAARRFSQVQAFWMTLLLLWCLAGLGLAYRGALPPRDASPPRRALRRAAAWWLLLALALWGARYALLALDVPAAWQAGKAPLAPLFDPSHLASQLGRGLMRSTGEFFLTVVAALATAGALAPLAVRYRRRAALLLALRRRARQRGRGAARAAAALLLAAGAVGALTLLVALLAVVLRHAVLDSTLDYFARTGLVPEPLVVLLFIAMLGATGAVVLAAVCLVWVALGPLLAAWPTGRAEAGLAVGVGAAMAVPVVLAYALLGLGELVPAPALLAFLATVGGLAALGLARPLPRLALLTLRNLLLLLFLHSLLLYPLFYRGVDAQRRQRMVDAADLFEEGRDPRALFAIEQVLEEAAAEPAVTRLLARADTLQPALDSVATVLLRNSLLASLGTYDLSVVLFDAAGRPVGRYDEAVQQASRSARNVVDSLEFDILRVMHAESGKEGPLVEQVTGRLDRDRFQYRGVMPLKQAGEEVVGWVMARAEPPALLRAAGTPFPRVLLPSGLYGGLYDNLSMAEFRGGVHVRSFGEDFGRYRLEPSVVAALRTQAAVWRTETVEAQPYLTYYRRRLPPGGSLAFLRNPAAGPVVLAVRMPSLAPFDHLYYLLRLSVSGLFVVVPLFLAGLAWRRRAGLLPAPRVRFRDKVLSAFLGVGIVTVAAVGVVGLRVVTSENERAVQSWLRQRLEQVEEVLSVEARADELPYQVLQRTSVDSLAARVGLDVNVYEGPWLRASSRPQLVRDRLIGERLPAAAYAALYLDGYRFTYTAERVGEFTYTAGYRTLLDEEGRPRFVLSVPTLPEQERIEEERARTVAYLFGALLLLVLVVMLTASLLAGALARPMGRLRAGLQAVARGRFERPLPVDTRDEIGELVETFNEMQAQLAESRRQLAQQERQLAWREMARQVAHEIKNPLTPMKLSVQHLRRAFGDLPEGADGRFAGLFDRITTTLIEQIDALARIANEFSTFARLPRQVLEELDLNAVAQEAAVLMQEETAAPLVLRLDPQPLIVRADHEELRRVYINLIKNAFQALPDPAAGRIVVATRREVRQGESWAFSTVADNGSGIPAELRSRIFEPNFSTKTSGTGLGLAIARKSIEEVQGEIGFDTHEGEGTTFWLRLPLVAD